MFIIEPFLAFKKVLNAPLVVLKTDFKLVAITSSNCSSLILIKRLSLVIPALLTITSNVPKSFTTSEINCSASAKFDALLL